MEWKTSSSHPSSHPNNQPTGWSEWTVKTDFAENPRLCGIRESPGPPPKSSLPCVFFGQSQGCQRSAASRWPRKSNGWNSAVRKPLRKKQRPTSWTLLQYLCSWWTESNFIITFLGNIIWDIRIIPTNLTNPIKKGNFLHREILPKVHLLAFINVWRVGRKHPMKMSWKWWLTP